MANPWEEYAQPEAKAPWEEYGGGTAVQEDTGFTPSRGDFQAQEQEAAPKPRPVDPHVENFKAYVTSVLGPEKGAAALSAITPESVAKLGASYGQNPMTRIAEKEVMAPEEVLPAMMDSAKGFIPRIEGGGVAALNMAGSDSAKALAGAYNKTAEKVEEQFTLQNALLGSALPGAPTVIQKAAALAFGAQFIKGLPDKYKAYLEAKTPEERGEAAADFSVDYLFALGSIAHGASRSNGVSELRTGGMSQREVDNAIRLAPEPPKNSDLTDQMVDGIVASKDAAAKAVEKNPGNKTLSNLNFELGRQLSDVPIERQTEARARNAAQATSPSGEAPEAPQGTEVPSVNPLTDSNAINQPTRGGSSELFNQAKAEAAAGAPEPQPEPPSPVEQLREQAGGEEPAPAAAEAVQEVAPAERDGYAGGPGAMGPVEALEMESGRQTTALKRAVVDAQRTLRGGEEIPVEQRKYGEELLSKAEDEITSDPSAGEKVVARVLASGVAEQSISPKDAATLLVERTRLRNERAQAEDILNDPSATDVDKAQARERFQSLEEQIDRADRASRRAGTAWSDFGRLYQQVMRDDYTIESLERKARAAKGGGPLSEKQVSDLKALSEKYSVLEAERDRLEKAAQEGSAFEEMSHIYEQVVAQVERESPKVSKPILDVARSIVDRLNERADAARQRLRDRLSRASSGVDPAIVLDVAEIAASHIANIGLKLSEVSARLIEEFGPEIKPYIKSAWEKAKKIIEDQKGLPAAKDVVKKGQAAKSTSPEQVNSKIKADAVAGDELNHKLVYDLAKAHVKAGVRGENELMTKVFEDVKKSFPNATERDVRRAFVEKATFPKQDVVSKTLAENRSLVRMQESIDRLTEGRDALKSGPQRDKATQAIREKQAQLNELLKKRQGPPSPERLASMDEARQTALKNRIADIDKELQTGERAIADRSETPRSKETESLMMERDAMMEKLRQVREEAKPKKSEADVAQEKAQAAVDRAATALDRQQRINSGELKLEPKEKAQPLSTLEKELRDKTEELRKAKREAEKMTPEERYNRTRIKQIQTQIEDAQRRLRESDFAPNPKKAAPAKNAEVAKAEADLREMRRQINDEIGRIKYEGRSIPQKTVDAITNSLKFITAIKVLGHGTVGMITHAGGLLYRPGSAMPIWWRNFGRQFRLWTSKDFHNQAIYNLTHDPEFNAWKEAGASIDPEKQYTDYGLYAKWLGKLGEGGKRGFDALKIARLELNKADWAKVPQEIKADPEASMEMRKAIASMNNKATGASPKTSPVGKDVESGFYSLAKNPISEAAFFAPRLYASRWSRVLLDPIKTAQTFIDWKNSTPAAQQAALLRTKHAVGFIATYLGALATNQAVLSATGSSQKVNLNDPTKSDWLKFKGAGKEVVADGGLLDPVRLLGQIVIGDLIMDRTRNQQYRDGTRYQKVTADLAKYARSKLNPTVGLVVDSATGTDYSGRPLPFSNEPPKFKDQPKYSWGEWLLKQGPIPLSQGVQVAYDEMRKQGISSVSAMQILKGAAVSVLGATGAHITEDHSGEHAPVKNHKTSKH